MKPADRLNPARRQRAVAAPRPLNDGLLPIANRQENSVATAVERGISQRDARFGPAAGHRNHPTLRLFKSGLARKQRSGVAIIADAEKHHIEQRPGRIQDVRRRSSRAKSFRRRPRPAAASALRSVQDECCLPGSALWTAAPRASSRNCCPGGREERSVHRPRTNGRGSRGTPPRLAAGPEAHTNVAASIRRSNRWQNGRCRPRPCRKANSAAARASASAFSKIQSFRSEAVAITPLPAAPGRCRSEPACRLRRTTRWLRLLHRPHCCR